MTTDETSCFQCHQAITWQTLTVPEYAARTGWVDQFPADPFLCPKAPDHIHRPSADWTPPPPPPEDRETRAWLDRQLAKAPPLSREQRAEHAALMERHHRDTASRAQRKWEAIATLGYQGPHTTPGQK